VTREGADTAVVTSALVMAGMYAYRRMTEPIGERSKRKPNSASNVAEGVIGRGDLLPTGTWVVGFGVSFIVISILASVSPTAGGYSAILVATTSFFANGEALMEDLKTSSKSSLSKQQGKVEVTTEPSPNAEVAPPEPAFYKTVTT
jgi:hypothetical protein